MKTLKNKYKETRDRYFITTELQRILDRQQFSLNNAVLDVEISDLALKYHSLVSPVSGIVTNIDYPTSGINITPANFSITVVDPESLYFKSEVDEEDIIKIKKGRKQKLL